MKLALVSCVKEKGAFRCPAKDLYVSSWFKKARRWVESQGIPWFILSEEYHLLCPETSIEPYEKSLKQMDNEARRDWNLTVWTQLRPHLAGVDEVIILAGEDHRWFLQSQLGSEGIKVSVPMEGLRQGEQLQWLNKMNKR